MNRIESGGFPADVPRRSIPEVCQMLTHTLRQMQIGWPLAITISGFDGRRPSSTSLVLGGEAARLSRCGEGEQALNLIASLAAAHLRNAKELALELAGLYGVSVQAVVEALDEQLEQEASAGDSRDPG